MNKMEKQCTMENQRLPRTLPHGAVFSPSDKEILTKVYGSSLSNQCHSPHPAVQTKIFKSRSVYRKGNPYWNLLNHDINIYQTPQENTYFIPAKSDQQSSKEAPDKDPVSYGPNHRLDKVKADFCAWLDTLGESSTMSSVKEELDHLFSVQLGGEVRLGIGNAAIETGVSGDAEQKESAALGTLPRDPSADRNKEKICSATRGEKSGILPLKMERRSELNKSDSLMRPRGGAVPQKNQETARRRVKYGEWFVEPRRWVALGPGEHLQPAETAEETLAQRSKAERTQRLNASLAGCHGIRALGKYLEMNPRHPKSKVFAGVMSVERKNKGA